MLSPPMLARILMSRLLVLPRLLAINDTISSAVTEAVTNAIARVVADTITTVINAMVLVAANIHTFQPVLVRTTRGQFRYCAVQST